MGGDYSRSSFDALRDHSGVLMQQGHPTTDADWTEQSAIVERRFRVATVDILGRAMVPAETPTGFEIQVAAGPTLTIGRGRIYVDGLLAENHGLIGLGAPPVFDRARETDGEPTGVLDEMISTEANDFVDYAAQPYLPAPPDLPVGPGPHLAYVDVWRRELTALKDPRLLEPALGGIDTANRWQTAWQVRVLANVGADADCGSELEAWDALVAPTPSRLTTATIEFEDPDDPCLIPPGGGYRGLENQLYRVEIHSGGELGEARFKWSRENASVGASVEAFEDDDRLEVRRIGRDSILRFRTGDWVEVTDDRRELNGLSGDMRRVEVDEDTNILLLDAPLSADLIPTNVGGDTAAARHSRVIRWDQSRQVLLADGTPWEDLDDPGSDGLIPVPDDGSPVRLEAGITVAFSVAVAGGELRAQDYWMFAARTEGAQIEILEEAPPHGVHHHFCRLALVSLPADGEPEVLDDCRPRPTEPGVGCCTVVVQPGESIQDAIDSLPEAGGCVCLRSGLHNITATIEIARGNVSLHGESLGAIVQGAGGASLLSVDAPGATGIRVHGITWRGGEAADAAAMIRIRGADGMVFEDNRLESLGRSGSIGVLGLLATGLRIVGCEMIGMAVCIRLDRGSDDAAVVDNRLAPAAPTPDLPTTIGILARGLVGPLVAEGNRIEETVNGIILNDLPAGTPRSLATASRIAANYITLVPSPDEADQCFGIDAAPPAATVAHNRIGHDGGRLVAIRATGDASLIDGNIIVSSTEEPGQSIAVTIGFEADDEFLPVERIIVSNNALQGGQHGIVVLGVARARVSGNTLHQPQGSFGLGISLNAADAAIVADNLVTGAGAGIFSVDGERNRFAGNVFEGGGAIGIALFRESGPAVVMNRMTGLSSQAIAAIQVLGRFEVIENRIVNCGFGGETAIGIGAFLVFGEWHVEANEVMDTGLSPVAGGPIAPLARGISGDLILEARIQSNLVTYSDPNARPPAVDDRALRIRGMLEYSLDLASGRFVFGFPIQVADNKFIGSGFLALVELMSQPVNDNIVFRFERVIYTGNYHAHFSMPFNDQFPAATVILVGRRCSVASNHVKATTPGFRSWRFNDGMPGPFIGNVSHTSTGRAAASQFPNPEASFNMIA